MDLFLYHREVRVRSLAAETGEIRRACSERASEAQVVFSYGKEGSSEVCVLGRRNADDENDGRTDGRGRTIGWGCSPFLAPPPSPNDHILPQPISTGSSAKSWRILNSPYPLNTDVIGECPLIDLRRRSLGRALPVEREGGTEIGACNHHHHDNRQRGDRGFWHEIAPPRRLPETTTIRRCSLSDAT